MKLIKVPAAMALNHTGSPISKPAAATPAYSAQIVPKLANSSPSTAAYPQWRPQRSRTKATKPLPVAAPRRTATRWNCTNRIVDAGMIQSSRYPCSAPRIEYVVMPAGSSSESPASKPGPSTARNDANAPAPATRIAAKRAAMPRR